MPITTLVSLHSILLVVGPIGGTLHVPGNYPTIQACIDAAVDGDECVVAPGTYNETINLLGKAITIRSSGGRDVTIIDATGIDGSVVTCATGEGPNTVLEGFTLTGGSGTQVSGAKYGGGMYNLSSSPTVTDCTFSGNSAQFGAGMYNFLNSHPTVTACTFNGNASNYSGGGMYNFLNSSPTVADCTFSGNSAHFFGGGGMYNQYSSNPTVINCTFSGNSAFYGGGIRNYESNPLVTRCIFNGNRANSHGGAMFNDFGSHPTVTGCMFRGNTSGRLGAGMHNESNSNAAITTCAFLGNMAEYYGGGIHNVNSSPAVTSCLFSGNTAYWGGGVSNVDSDPTIANCTFGRNVAYTVGSGLYNCNGSPIVSNCLFRDEGPTEIGNFGTSVPAIGFSDVQGGLPVGALDDGGNFNLDPMFLRPPNPGPDGYWNGVNDDYGDLRLQAGSPCINAGDPAFVPQAGETDLEGHARVLCGRVDIGAYEFGIGDYDCNQMVDLTDFSQWPECMSGPGATAVSAVPQLSELTAGCESFDFDGDADVDLLDLAAFQTVFDSTDANIAVFDDPDSNFRTRDVRDVDDEFVRFDTSTNSIIWAATGTAYQQGAWPVNSVFLGTGGFFQVRFGTKDGQRRAYFTETGPATICQIRVIGANLQISATNVPVPQGP